jgi:hypothetical protein
MQLSGLPEAVYHFGNVPCVPAYFTHVSFLGIKLFQNDGGDDDFVILE